MASGTIAARVNIRLRQRQIRSLEQVSRALDRPMSRDVGRRIIRAVRGVINEEFTRGVWLRPSGGSAPWKQGHDFGSHKAKRPPLGGPGGRLARAWAGGRGGFSESDGNSVTIGVRLPYAAVHRGGVENVQAGRITVIRPRRKGKGGRPAMFWFLGLVLGVWLRKETLRRGLKVPARPHATDNPKTRQAVAEILADLIASRAR